MGSCCCSQVDRDLQNMLDELPRSVMDVRRRNNSTIRSYNSEEEEYRPAKKIDTLVSADDYTSYIDADDSRRSFREVLFCNDNREKYEYRPSQKINMQFLSSGYIELSNQMVEASRAICSSQEQM